jgi:hypothetical protein
MIMRATLVVEPFLDDDQLYAPRSPPLLEMNRTPTRRPLMPPCTRSW